MKIKQGFILHQVGDDYIIMQDGPSHVDFSKIINLNQTSAVLWKEIEHKEFDEDAIAEILMNRYVVDAERAQQDARAFIGFLQQEGIIE